MMDQLTHKIKLGKEKRERKERENENKENELMGKVVLLCPVAENPCVLFD